MNVAQGLVCTFDPAPNYPNCTDASDTVQLTDGAYAPVGYMWTKTAAVGWLNTAVAYITFDLGSEWTIGGLTFNSQGRGLSSVHYPASINVLTSLNGTDWSVADDLVLSAIPTPEHESTTTYTFTQSHFLDVQARYVKLAVVASGSTIVVDEIQVIRRLVNEADAVMETVSDIPTWLPKGRTQSGIKRRIYLDAQSLSGQISASALPSSASLLSSITTISNSVQLLTVATTNDFKTLMPMHDLQQDLFDVQSAYWRDQGLSNIVVWHTNRYDYLAPTTGPNLSASSLDIVVMTNETRADVLNLSNAGTGSSNVTFSVTGLPGGTNPDYISVFEVPFTDTSKGVPIAAALLPLQASGGLFSVTVPVGLTKQVWFSFHPTNVASGSYTGAVSVLSQSIPVTLTVYPFSFPTSPTMTLHGMDYTDIYQGEMTSTNRDSMVALLQDHLIQTTWAAGWTMTMGTYDVDGHMLTEPSSTNAFQAWVERWPNARRFFVYKNFTPTSITGLTMGTAAHNTAVGEWINWWVVRMALWGVTTNELAIHITDEASTTSDGTLLIQYGAAIKAAQPGVTLWTDPRWGDPSIIDPDVWVNQDVLVPAFDYWLEKGASYQNWFKASGKQLGIYANATKSGDPYSRQRLNAWHIWEQGGVDNLFWATHDADGWSAWNEYVVTTGAMTPLFLNPNDPTVYSGKHMEALVEGVEDFQELQMLKDRMAALAGEPSDATLVDAQALLDTAAATVLVGIDEEADSRWVQYSGDRSTADTVRKQILDTLVALSAY